MSQIYRKDPWSCKHEPAFDRLLSGGSLRISRHSRLRWPRSSSSVFALTSFKLRRTPRFALVLRAAAPRVARRAKRGGPGRTRTCNQTVMSGMGGPENAENIDEFGEDW